MSRQIEITISGVGGQGTILCGSMIAEAAVEHDGKRATLSSDYGVETRGTFVKSDVIVSDEDIFFPTVTNADVIVCLAPVAYRRYSGKVDARTTIIFNSDEIAGDPARSGNERGVAINSLSRDCGNPAVANILTMGVVIGKTGVVEADGARELIRRFFAKRGEKMVDMNLTAFQRGLEIGQAMNG